MRIIQFADWLGIKKPYEIEIRSKSHKKMTAAYWGLYTEKGNLSKHLIRVYLGNFTNPDERPLESIIAHEMIHAWQEENGINEIHGSQFKNLARWMSLEFKLDYIYIPDIDTP